MRLHPALSWLRNDSGNLQIRLPTGNHITVDEHVDIVESILNSLAGGIVEKDDVKQGKSDEIVDDLFDFLFSLNAIEIENFNGNDGTFRTYANYHGKIINSWVTRKIELADGPIRVNGEGAVAESVRNVVEGLAHENSKSIRVVCADFENTTFFQSENSKALAAEEPITFIRWSRERLILGPLMVNQSGPCYTCYLRRLLASSNYVPEMKALFKQQAGEFLQLDYTLERLLQFAIARHLELILAESFHFARVGYVERWNPFSLDLMETVRVLPVPKCEQCGNARTRDTLRAVRDLI